MKNFILISFLLALFIAPIVIGEPIYREGEHYFVIQQMPKKNNAEIIEVTEVFWYACPGCYELEGAIKIWKAKLPERVRFSRSPAVLRPSMAIHAKLYFLPALLKIERDLHDEIFKEIHENKNKLSTEEAITQFFEKFGIDKNVTSTMLNSNEINIKVKQADARARRHKVEATPTFIINGQYRISTQLDGGLIEMLDVADFLIQKIVNES